MYKYNYMVTIYYKDGAVVSYGIGILADNREEADNLGEVLLLLSYLGDTDNATIHKAINEAMRLADGNEGNFQL